MDQRAVQHPRHDLHVAMRMSVEPGSWRDGVVVADHEYAVVGVGPQRVDAGVERVPSVQPPDLGLMAIRSAADVHARRGDRGRTHAGLLLQSLDLSSHTMKSQAADLSSPRRSEAEILDSLRRESAKYPSVKLDESSHCPSLVPARRQHPRRKVPAACAIADIVESPNACARGTTTGYGFVTSDQWKTAPHGLGSPNNEC